jgi:4-nitrophenyl phosphatase
MVETLKKLVSLGKTVVYCSNNSTKSRKDFVDKFASAGVPVARSHVYSSSSTIASLLLATPGFDAAAHKVFTIGFTGLREELRERGIQVVDSNDVAPPSLGMAGLSAAAPDPAVRAVVVGLDPSMTYTKAAYATILLLERDCLFFATNRDRTFPGARRTLPGAGSCVAMVAAAASREPTVAGKPSQAMFAAIAADHGAAPTRTLMVGDRLDTDIAFAAAAGMDSLLVYTGVTDRTAFERAYTADALPAQHRPTYTAEAACVLAGIPPRPFVPPTSADGSPIGPETASVGVAALPAKL